MLAPLGPLVDETNTGKLWKKKKTFMPEWYRLVLVQGTGTGTWQNKWKLENVTPHESRFNNKCASRRDIVIFHNDIFCALRTS